MSTLVFSERQTSHGRFLRNREIILLIDGTVHDQWLSHDERTECLKNAIQHFDSDLEKVAEDYKGHRFGAYLWLFTPDFVRSESVDGLFRAYYMKELMRRVSEKTTVSQIVLKVPLHFIERSHLEQYTSNISYRNLTILRSFLYSFMLALKIVGLKFFLNLKYLFISSNDYFDGTLIDTSTRIQRNRYDSLEDVKAVFQNHVRFFSGEQRKIHGVSSHLTVVFKREINLKIFINSLVKSLQLKQFLKREKNKLPHMIFKNHAGLFKMLLYWDLIISQKCIKKYLSKSDIQNIVQVSTLTKPVYRSLSSYSKRKNIRFIQVASRSLMRFRASDRLLRCDVLGYNNTSTADHFIVKDQFSTRVINEFSEMGDNFYVGSRHKVEFKESNVNKSHALLLLFNHRRDLCEKLLEEVRLSGISQMFETVIFRCHPSCVITQSEIQSMASAPNIIDLTGQTYEMLKDYHVFAISGPTTAALEAVQFGAVVYWVPYIWEEGILMDEVMSEVGLKCENNQHIFNLVESHLNHREVFLKQLNKDSEYCNNNLNSDKLISEQLAVIISGNS